MDRQDIYNNVSEHATMLDTSNPNNYHYKARHLGVHVLGGLRANKLESLRVTLALHKVTDPHDVLRHSIDLYNDNQVERFVRRVAEQERTHLQSKVSELIPEEDRVEITVLSANAFYYFDRTELRHRLILIEDLDGAESVLYPLRELQSKKRITKTMVHRDTKGTTRTIHLTVEGPVSVAGCTTQESIYEDNSNRSFCSTSMRARSRTGG